MRDVTAVEGTVLEIICTHTNATIPFGNGILLHSFNGVQLVGADTPQNEVTRDFHLSVDRAKNGVLITVSTFNPRQSPVTVTCEWNGYRH